jgi:muramidase (phage lysozyme)
MPKAITIVYIARGTESSNLANSNFGSLISRIHHIWASLFSDPKSEKVRIEKSEDPAP